MIKINNWNVSNADFITPKLGDEPGINEFIVMDIPDLAVSPFTNLFIDNDQVSSNLIGNSVETVSIFDDRNTASYYKMSIEDGTYRGYIQIFKGSIRVQGNETPVPVLNTDGAEHRYTLTLKGDTLTVYFDAKKIASETISEASQLKQICIGFTEAQTGAALVKFRYIKTTKGAYNYINAADIDFELQVDTSDEFNSPNLKTYTKADFTVIPENGAAWDPVSLMCGKYTGGSYDFLGLVQAATIKLPPKQDGAEYTFYYRVRFLSDLYESDYSRTYLTQRVKPESPEVIPNTVSLVAKTTANSVSDTGYLLNTREVPTGEPVIFEILSEQDHGYKAFIPPVDNAGVVLPDTPVSDNWTVQIYNASDLIIKVYDGLKFEQEPVMPWTVVSYTYSATANNWSSSIMQRPLSFILPADITNTVFDAVYNHHLPAYDDVYTKVYNSGNVADVLRSEASEINEMYAKLYTQSANISNFTADRDDLNSRWKSVFGLDNSLFKNSAEMRDTMQQLVLNLRGEMLEKTILYLISCITGANPEIIEYKDVYFNVLWSEAELKQLPKDQTYYIYDENNPSFDVKPFVLYGGADQAATWQINIYDPYNIKYSQELILRILDFLKPVYTYVVVNFYDFEGVPYTKKYYYGTDNYLESEYNK